MNTSLAEFMRYLCNQDSYEFAISVNWFSDLTLTSADIAALANPQDQTKYPRSTLDGICRYLSFRESKASAYARIVDIGDVRGLSLKLASK